MEVLLIWSNIRWSMYKQAVPNKMNVRMGQVFLGWVNVHGVMLYGWDFWICVNCIWMKNVVWSYGQFKLELKFELRFNENITFHWEFSWLFFFSFFFGMRSYPDVWNFQCLLFTFLRLFYGFRWCHNTADYLGIV